MNNAGGLTKEDTGTCQILIESFRRVLQQEQAVPCFGERKSRGKFCISYRLSGGWSIAPASDCLLTDETIVIGVVDSHTQPIVLAIEETTVTQWVSH